MLTVPRDRGGCHEGRRGCVMVQCYGCAKRVAYHDVLVDLQGPAFVWWCPPCAYLCDVACTPHEMP